MKRNRRASAPQLGKENIQVLQNAGPERRGGGGQSKLGRRVRGTILGACRLVIGSSVNVIGHVIDLLTRYITGNENLDSWGWQRCSGSFCHVTYRASGRDRICKDVTDCK